MQYMPRNHNHAADGFTLIEMLVIAPIVLLAIGGFVALMVSMVGDILATRDYNNTTYNTQDALNRIEQDVRLSSQFLTTTGTTSPQQGSDNNFSGTAPFIISDTNNMLLLSLPATDKNPVDATRQIINYANQPNPCDTTQTANKIFIFKVAYFIKNGSLWRRTILPPYDTNATPDNNTVCTPPWQQNSCSVGYINDGHCQTNDVELVKNVQSLTVQYFADPTSTVNVFAAGAATATTLSAAISTASTTAGRTINTSQSVRATKLNSQAAVNGNSSQTPLTITQQPSNTTVHANDTNITIPASSSISTASVLWQQSSDNGTTWQDMANQSSATLLLQSIDASWNNRQFRAIFTNGSDSVTTSAATLTVINWTSLALQNNWTDFGTPYSTNSSIVTSGGVVMLKGLLKRSGTPTQNEIIGTLPSGSRPSGKLMFQTSSSADSSTGMHTSRIDINTDGTIHFIFGDSVYLTLEGINFMASNNTFTPITPSNGWVNYGASAFGDTFASAGSLTDSLGRTHTQGVVKSGTISDGTLIINLPAAQRNSNAEYLHITNRSNGFGYIGVDAFNNTGIVAKGGPNSNAVMAINSMFYPGSIGGWSNLTLTNGWVAYAGGYATPQYIKAADNIVTIKGLIKSGTTTDGTVVATLPQGYCPRDRTLLYGVTNAKSVRYDVRQTTTGVPANGCSIEIYYGDATWASLDAITYLAEQ
jgi:hypothetical protein